MAFLVSDRFADAKILFVPVEREKGVTLTQPAARVEILRDTYYGVTVEDPYRWMEDWKGEELQTWLKAQAAYTKEYFEALPEREALLKRITELSGADPILYSLQVAGGRYFYLRRDSNDNLAKLVVRTGLDGQEKVLFDPNRLKDEIHTAIDWYTPSRDGKLVAYGISPGGSEDSTLHILEVDSGKILDLALSRTWFGGVSWLEDSRSFVYQRFPDRPADAPPTEHFNDACMYLHQLGNDPEKDQAVFGRGVNAGVEIADEDFPFLILPQNSNWMIGLIMHGDLSEITIYAAPRPVLSDPTTCTWTKIVDIEDAVTGYAVHDDTIYFRTHKDAPHYKVIATSLKNPDLRRATLVVPKSEAVIEDIRVAGDYLLMQDLVGGIGRMRRVKLSGGELEPVPLPFDGTIIEWTNEADSPEVLLEMAAWTASPRIYRFHVNERTLKDTGWLLPSPIDTSAVETHEVQVPAKDGTLVPLSIIHKKGLKLDGNNPTLLTGYGSYGISITPSFRPTMFAWYERGGVYAVAHIRGGGEYGKEWHQAGQMLNKHNTIDDFISCAEYLIAQKYTRPERLAGEGTSGGGIPNGGALVKRPDLWAVMVMRVAVTNTLRFEFTENGPPNIQEFGSVTTEEGFRGLQITDSYSKVKDGVKYPAVLLTTGLNDPRVVVWQATKMAARLQAATTSGKPVLLRVEFQAGHGMGSTRQQFDEELADKLAFLSQQMGV